MSAIIAVKDFGPPKGRGIVAVCPIEAGARVFSVPPDVAVLYSPFVATTCGRCFHPLAGNDHSDNFLSLCQSCERSSTDAYREARVQAKAWFETLDAEVRAGDTDYLRFLLAYSARVQSGDARLAMAMADLCSNEDSQAPDVKQFCRAYARLTATTFRPKGLLIDEEALYQVLLRVKSNALGFPFNSAETMGWAVQLDVCMLNHSCVPNCAIAQNSETGDMEIRSLRPIGEGDELFVSYIHVPDLQSDVGARTRQLLEKYRFLCGCPLCVEQRARGGRPQQATKIQQQQ